MKTSSAEKLQEIKLKTMGSGPHNTIGVVYDDFKALFKIIAEQEEEIMELEKYGNHNCWTCNCF